tara:strand:- start:83 stop:601 length:519 start_codon:yes stop_codon:yes gene_type:complete
MMNILEKFEQNQIKELSKKKTIPDFKPGDTVKVHVKVKDGEKERNQIFEGVCIAYNNAGLNTSFSVRKVSYGEGVERVFPIYSPQISKIEVSKFGDVRRSKLYYLRQRSGKSARITEKNKFLQREKIKDEVVNVDNTEANKTKTVELKKSDESGNNKNTTSTKKDTDQEKKS